MTDPVEPAPTGMSKWLGLPPAPFVGASFVVHITLAATAAYLVASQLALPTPLWAVTSAVLVISPALRASLANVALRVVANLVGAGVGFAVSLLGVSPVPSLALGLPLVAGLCRLIGIDAAARTAAVAMVIVLFKDPLDVRGLSLVRVGLVVLGCGVALAVTVLVTLVEKLVARLGR